MRWRARAPARIQTPTDQLGNRQTTKQKNGQERCADALHKKTRVSQTVECFYTQKYAQFH